VFIDGIDEVTDLLARSPSIADAVEAIALNAAVVGGDGHSDYGRAFLGFHRRFARSIGPRTNLIVLGDARNNYHRPEAWVLADLHRRARKVIWLNPEPRAYWGSGDSIMGQYAPHCDGVFECRNLRQLRAFVDELA
ncbi:MAG TPA: VWA domain-containing protein, partial [Acidimicrobiales bacterium]|nr:VWA domain-containing protein [Acidimicrobiales bacterium]